MSALLDRQRVFTQHLVDGFPEYGLAGLSLVGGCAVTGNASVENHVKPITTGPKDHGSDGALQWRLGRLDGKYGLKRFAAARGLNWATLRAQAAFTLWELANGEAPGDDRYAELYAELRAGTKPIATLTANFCRVYERPNMTVAHLDLRIRHAKSVYMIMKREADERKVNNAIKGGAVIAAGGGVVTTVGTSDTDAPPKSPPEAGASVILWLFVAAALFAFAKWRERNAAAVEPAEIEEDTPTEDLPRLTSSARAELESALQNVREAKDAFEKATAAVEAARARFKAEIDEAQNVYQLAAAGIVESAQPDEASGE